MSGLLVPTPRVPISIRVGTMEDIPFMDSLQKKNSKALGHFPTKQFEGYVAMGAVLVAVSGHSSRVTCGETSGVEGPASDKGQVTSDTRLGYLISKDRYLKRDELGVIFQLCVGQGEQRKLVGATLVAEAFRRSAYGCRLYCLWCAQDLEANYFWESLGFVPIAFRCGSSGKKRVHIFWQRRIGEGDVETKWWYPFQTSGGAIRADRIVLPIPPGVRWQDVKAIEVPGMEREPAPRRRLPGPRKKDAGATPVVRNGPGPGMVGILVGGRIRYVPKPGYVAPASPAEAASVPLLASPEPKRKREKAPAPKFDPAILAKVRELRDRWVEHVNGGEMLLESAGKYEVTRALGASPGSARLVSTSAGGALPSPRRRGKNAA
jgi:hypothetical protein